MCGVNVHGLELDAGFSRLSAGKLEVKRERRLQETEQLRQDRRHGQHVARRKHVAHRATGVEPAGRRARGAFQAETAPAQQSWGRAYGSRLPSVSPRPSDAEAT